MDQPSITLKLSCTLGYEEYEGTRLDRQELYAEMLEADGALWSTDA